MVGNMRLEVLLCVCVCVCTPWKRPSLNKKPNRLAETFTQKEN